MDTLPDELKYMIAAYLDTATDSSNFRLTSKSCARIGAEEHFKNFPFGNSPAASAIARMQQVASSPLVKHVKGLDYAYEDARGHGPQTPDETKEQARVLAGVALGFSDAGAKIEVLQTQCVSFNFFSEPKDEFATACKHVKDLTLGFRGKWYEASRSTTARTETNMRAYLRKLERLEILWVGFDESDFKRIGHSLRDIVPLDCVWPALKSVEFSWIYVDGEDLVQVMRNHGDTLKCVHFTNLKFRVARNPAAREADKKRKWRAVFEQIGKMKLMHGEVDEGRSHGLGEENVEWVVKGERGREVVIKTDLKKYLVDEGDGEDEEHHGDDGEDVEAGDEDIGEE